MLFYASSLLALAVTVSGLSLPKLHFKIPSSMYQTLAQNDGCIMPASFSILNFTLDLRDSVPNSGLSDLSTIYFLYMDGDTGITTECNYNSTSSVNVGPAGLTPRYACDNPIVTFIWADDDNTLTMIEKACPDSAGSGPGMEASGAVTLTLNCLVGFASRGGPDGAPPGAISCWTLDEEIPVPFTSLQPTPPS